MVGGRGVRPADSVVDGAVVIRATGEGGSYAFAAGEDGAPGCLAGCYRFGVGIISVLDPAEVATLCRSRALLPWTAASVLDPDQFRTGYSLAVQINGDLDLRAGTVNAMVVVCG